MRVVTPPRGCPSIAFNVAPRSCEPELEPSLGARGALAPHAANAMDKDATMGARILWDIAPARCKGHALPQPGKIRQNSRRYTPLNYKPASPPTKSVSSGGIVGRTLLKEQT